MYNRLKRPENRIRLKKRFKVESFNSCIKNCARVRDRYDKLTIMYSATHDIAFLCILFIRICDKIINYL